MTFNELIQVVKYLKDEYYNEKGNLWDRFINGDSNVIVESPVTYISDSGKVTRDLLFTQENQLNTPFSNLKNQYDQLVLDHPNIDFNYNGLKWIDRYEFELTNQAFEKLQYCDSKIKEYMIEYPNLQLHPTLTMNDISIYQTLLHESAEIYRNIVGIAGWKVREEGQIKDIPEVQNLLKYLGENNDIVSTIRRNAELSDIIARERDNDAKGRKTRNYDYYKSFSGTDANAHIVFPDKKEILLGQVSTISYSILRVKNIVKTLGRITPRGITKGSRIVAGSIIFAVFNNHWVNEVKSQLPELFEGISKIKADELPPFDIIITYANEYGATSYYNIYGLTVTEEGQVVSIEDAMTENVCQFVARDVDCNQPVENIRSGSSKLNWNNNELFGKFKLNEYQLEIPKEVPNFIDNEVYKDNEDAYIPQDLLIDPNKILDYDLNIDFRYMSDAFGNSDVLNNVTIEVDYKIDFYSKEELIHGLQDSKTLITGYFALRDQVKSFDNNIIDNMNIEINYIIKDSSNHKLGEWENVINLKIGNNTNNENIKNNNTESTNKSFGQWVITETVQIDGNSLVEFNIDLIFETPVRNPGSTYYDYNDIKNHWAVSEIMELSDRNIIAGYTNGSFKPDRKITRVEVASMLANTGTFIDTYIVNTFYDVPKTHWGFLATEVVNEKGYMIGYKDKYGKRYFNPDSDISRQEMIVAICMAKNVDVSIIVNSGQVRNMINDLYKDGHLVSDWAAPYIIYSSGGNWHNVLENGINNIVKLDPLGKATRAEVCYMMFNAFGY